MNHIPQATETLMGKHMWAEMAGEEVYNTGNLI